MDFGKEVKEKNLNQQSLLRTTKRVEEVGDDAESKNAIAIIFCQKEK